MTDKPERGSPAGLADAEAQRLVITRRDFLAAAGAALSSSILPAALTSCKPGGVAGGSGELPGPSPNFTVSLIRPADLLSLKIGFVNLSLSSNGSTLEPVSSSAPAYLQVDFGPQHVLEACFRKGDMGPGDGSTIKTLIAGNTRVVFVVPPGQSLEYSVPSLLRAFGTLAMNVPQLATPTAGLPQPMGVRVPPVGKVRIESYGGTAAGPRGQLRVANALPGTFVEPGPPTSIETALELPTRLLLAPNQYAGWAHSLSEVTSASQRIELWHTRLGVRAGDAVDESDAHADARTVRAFWARDNGFNPAATFPPPPATPPKMPAAPKVPRGPRGSAP